MEWDHCLDQRASCPLVWLRAILASVRACQHRHSWVSSCYLRGVIIPKATAGSLGLLWVIQDSPVSFLARTQQQKLRLMWVPTQSSHKGVPVSLQWLSVVPPEQQAAPSLTAYMSILSPHTAWTASREGHLSFCSRHMTQPRVRDSV